MSAIAQGIAYYYLFSYFQKEYHRLVIEKLMREQEMVHLQERHGHRYISALDSLYRLFRDYMQVIYTQIRAGKTEAAVNYLSTITGEISGCLKTDIENPVVAFAIGFHKLVAFEKFNIELEIFVKTPLDKCASLFPILEEVLDEMLGLMVANELTSRSMMKTVSPEYRRGRRKLYFRLFHQPGGGQ